MERVIEKTGFICCECKRRFIRPYTAIERTEDGLYRRLAKCPHCLSRRLKIETYTITEEVPDGILRS